MRDIIFRGKSVATGNWVYGDLYTRGQCAIYSNGEKIAVEEDTVGEYTGVWDAAGTRIFEGDIVRNEGNDNREYTVVWSDRYSGFIGKPDWSDSICDEITLSLFCGAFRITGNIHERHAHDVEHGCCGGCI